MKMQLSWGRYNFQQYIGNESLRLAMVAIIVALPLQAKAQNVVRAASPAENRASSSNIRSWQLLAQANSAPLNITGIKLNPTNKIIEVILESTGTIFDQYLK